MEHIYILDGIAVALCALLAAPGLLFFVRIPQSFESRKAVLAANIVTNSLLVFTEVGYTLGRTWIFQHWAFAYAEFNSLSFGIYLVILIAGIVGLCWLEDWLIALPE